MAKSLAVRRGVDRRTPQAEIEAADNATRAIANARTALAEAETIDDAKRIADQGKLLQAFIKSAGLGREMQNNGAQIVVLAQRAMGEMLAEMELHGGDRRSKSHDATLNLEGMGISKSQSSRCQKLSGVPIDALEKYFADTRAAGKLITVAGAMRIVIDEPDDNPSSRPHAFDLWREKAEKSIPRLVERCPQDLRLDAVYSICMICRRLIEDGPSTYRGVSMVQILDFIADEFQRSSELAPERIELREFIDSLRHDDLHSR